MRPKTLWLSLLPTLDAILNARTLTEAADRAFLTQPALSIALKKARAHFNDELVLFKGSKVELTELGMALRPRVRAPLAAAREALDLELDFHPATTRRSVKLMVNSYIEFALMPRLVAMLRAQAPLIELVVVPFHPLPADSNLLGDIDIIVAAASMFPPKYAHEKLLVERMTCLVANGNRQCGAAVSIEEWQRLQHATAADIHRIEEVAPPFLGHLAKHHRFALRAYSATSLPYTIVGTDLVVTSMRSYCEPCTHHLPLRLVELVGDDRTEAALTLDLSIGWKSHRSDEPFIRWLADCFKAVAAAAPRA